MKLSENKIEVKVYYDAKCFPEVGDCIRDVFEQLGMEQWAQGTDLVEGVSDMAFDWEIVADSYDERWEEIEMLLGTDAFDGVDVVMSKKVHDG